jgi:dipeptidyl aminopeptidase/acylaminoacyl peptidase
MSASQSPNYFLTRDFRIFTQLSFVCPEANYSWLLTELITWKMSDGKQLRGVLYKPGNFDIHKKYPVIFYYYEKKSDELNLYQPPETSPGWINIPWFVSRGFIVFTPDIYYKMGSPCESAYNSVVSAAYYLSQYEWVDSSKMGIVGHSWGGYETNCIITKTNLFKAAISASGIENFIGQYGSVMLGQDGNSIQNMYEDSGGQMRIQANLWQRPDLFIMNSPIFNADKIGTPLLMMNNKHDDIVPFAQGIELFTALRRLGKKVWMLQYDGEPHSLLNESTSKDFTVRITQFLNYYLKGQRASKWMVEGIPASLKGMDDGLELEPLGVEVGPSLITPEEQKNVDALKCRKPITVTFN